MASGKVLSTCVHSQPEFLADPTGSERIMAQISVKGFLYVRIDLMTSKLTGSHVTI